MLSVCIAISSFTGFGCGVLESRGRACNVGLAIELEWRFNRGRQYW